MAARIALTLACLAGIAACGQKGPLYLPGDPSQLQTEVPAQFPDQSGNEDEDDDGGGS